MSIYKEYQEAIQKTGLGEDTNPLYLACGLVGECKELEDVSAYLNMRDEVSDVVWYFSYLCNILDIEVYLSEYFASRRNSSSEFLINKAIDICQMINKHYRKHVKNGPDAAEVYLTEQMQPAFCEFAQELMDFITNEVGCTLEEVLIYNINKTYTRYGIADDIPEWAKSEVNN